MEEASSEAKNKAEAQRKTLMVLHKYLGIRQFRDPARSGGSRQVKRE